MLKLTKRTDRFGDYIRQAPDIARHLEEKHTRAWAVVMRQIMPRRTGAMIKSTEAVFDGSHWSVRIGVPYWGYVNSGTIYIDGQHFVEIAREFVRSGFNADLRNFNSFLR